MAATVQPVRGEHDEQGHIGVNQFIFVGGVWVPDPGGGGGGGGACTIADGADVAEGSTADAAWSGVGSGTVVSILKKMATSGTGGGPATIADGADVTLGAIADAAVQGDNPGTISAKLRGLNKSIAAGITVNGTVTTAPPANASTNIAQFGGTNVSLGQQLAAASLPVILPAATIATLTPPTTITANQGTAGSNAQAWWTRIGDAVSGPVTVKTGVSEPATGSDVALVVTMHPDSANINEVLQNTAWTVGDIFGATTPNTIVPVGGVYDITQPTANNGEVTVAQLTARGAMIVSQGVEGFTSHADLVAPTTVSGTFSASTQHITLNTQNSASVIVTFPGITGSVVGFFQPEGTNDNGTTWNALPSNQIQYGNPPRTDGLRLLSFDASKINPVSTLIIIPVAGLQQVRLTSFAWVSGTVSVQMSNSPVTLPYDTYTTISNTSLTPFWVELTDGNGSTGPGFTVGGVGAASFQQAMVVALSPNTPLPAGTNVIGHVITDTGSVAAVTGTVATTAVATNSSPRYTDTLAALVSQDLTGHLRVVGDRDEPVMVNLLRAIVQELRVHSVILHATLNSRDDLDGLRNDAMDLTNQVFTLN